MDGSGVWLTVPRFQGYLAFKAVSATSALFESSRSVIRGENRRGPSNPGPEFI